MKLYSKKQPERRIKPTKQKQKKSKSLIYNFFVLTFAVALIISYLAVFINPAKIWVPLFFGLYSTPIVIFNILLGLYGVFKQKKGAIITILVLLPSLLSADKFIKINNNEMVSSDDSLSILSYNVGRFASTTGHNLYAKTVEDIAHLIAEQDRDIVCLQEFKIIDTGRIKSLFPDYQYFQYSGFKDGKNGWFGNVTLSKSPIVNSETIKFKGSTNLCLGTDILYDEEPVRVYNCHLESYSISFTSIIKRIHQSSDLSDEFIQLHGRLREGTIKRVNQVEELSESIKNCSYKSIICGDFNETPTSYSYHSLLKNHKDSFTEGGNGFGATYAYMYPFLRIDYILVPSEWQCFGHKIIKQKYSDHYPVATVVSR